MVIPKGCATLQTVYPLSDSPPQTGERSPFPRPRGKTRACTEPSALRAPARRLAEVMGALNLQKDNLFRSASAIPSFCLPTPPCYTRLAMQTRTIIPFSSDRSGTCERRSQNIQSKKVPHFKAKSTKFFPNNQKPCPAPQQPLKDYAQTCIISNGNRIHRILKPCLTDCKP